MSKGERRRTRISSTIDKLPDDIKTELDVRLADTANTYEDLSAWLKAEGYEISKSAITKLEAADKKNAEDIAAVRGELGDLKADLPLIYTTREDFIRVSNNIDQKLDKLLYRSPAKEG